jgi:hypothetical protein
VNLQAPDNPPPQGLAIHLLGPPRVERGGIPVPSPRGHKVWGLLAYLIRSEAGQGGFAQYGFGCGLQMAALGGEPDLEGRASGEVHALQ